MTDQNQNWFDQNAPGAAPQQGQPAPQQAAPAPAAQPSGNWFDQNAPAPAVSDIDKNKAAVEREIAAHQIPENYGFTVGNMFHKAVGGAKDAVRFGIDVAKDISNSNKPLFFGDAESGDKESTFHKYVIAPSEEQNRKAQEGDQPWYESMGHSMAAAIPLVGPWAAGQAEKGGKTMDIGGTAAETAGQYLAGKGMELGVEKTLGGASHLSGSIAEKTATKLGASPRVAEIVGNIASVGAVKPLDAHMEALDAAVDKHIASERDYAAKSQALESARAATEADPADANAKNDFNAAQKDFNKASAKRADASMAVDKVQDNILKEIEPSVWSKMSLQKTGDIFGSAIGTTSDFNEAVTRFAGLLGKKAGQGFKDSLGSVGSDLKAIFNDDVDGKIKDPNSAADAIDQHIYQNIENPLQRESGATRNDTRPVTQNFRALAEARIDKFFEDNPGKAGSVEQEQAIKQRLLDRVMREQDLGGGITAPREPNLYEAESIRQGLKQYEPNETNGFRAVAYDLANFMRETIDKGYDERGVSGVKEARGKEAKLIDISEALRKSQTMFENQQREGPLARLWHSKPTVGLVATVGSILAHTGLLSGVGAGVLALDSLRQYKISDMAGNLSRAKELAGREPNVEATTPEITQQPPQQGAGPGPTGGSGPAPIRPNMPPPPQPPAPIAPPPINHVLNGELAAHFLEDRATTPEAYNGMLDRFKEKFETMKRSVADLMAKGQPLPEAYADEWKQAKDLNRKIQTEGAREDAMVEKQNQQAQAKYKKEVEKYKAKYQVETVKAQEAAAVEAEAAKAKAEQDEQARIDDILKDERVAHSATMKATEPVLNIDNASGHSSQEAHNHEHGHILTAVAEGLNPVQFLTSEHPEVAEDGGAAQVWTDSSGAEEGNKGIAQRVVTHLGGPAFDEVHQGIKLGRNTGASTDIAQARKILRDEGGLSGAALEKVFDALYERAKEHVSNPEALSLVEANAPLREAKLHKNFHMSPGRLEEYVKKLKGAYRNETPTSEGVREGSADEGVQSGEPTDTGAEGQEQNGPAQGVRAEAARESDEGAAKSGEERSSVKKEESRNLWDLKVPYKEGRTVPPERTAGENDAAIKAGGGVPGGIQKGDPEIDLPDLVLFHDPTTGSTLALKAGQVTPEAVKAQLQKSRKVYLDANPGESRIPTEGQPGYDATVHGNVEKSALKSETQIKSAQDDIRNAARQYNVARGLPEVNPAPVAEDPRVQEMGRVYDELKHNPNDPKVKASYDAFKNELDHQYDALTKAGFKFDTSKEDPYPSYEAMRQDILRNKHLTAWEGAAPPADHPLAERDPKTGFTYNEKFRLVHDVLGHAAHDADFSGNGEESAWNYHRQMFSPEAQPALAAETRGQVASFTRNGKFPDTQKAVLMPDEFNKRPEELSGVEKSSLLKSKAKEALDDIVARYGTSENVEPLRRSHSFILPDGKLVHLEGGTHSDVIAEHGGGNSNEKNGWDNRPEFINKSGAVRAHGFGGRSGDNLSFSVPKDGVTPEQLDTMRRAAGQGFLRNGTLNVERADMKAATKDQLSKQKDFPRGGDLDQMLKDIGAHPGVEKSALNKVSAFHGTKEDFDTFDTDKGMGSHFGTQEQAAKRSPEGKVNQYTLDLKNPLRMDDKIDWNPKSVSDELVKKGIISKEQQDGILRSAPFPELGGKGGANLNKDAYAALREAVQKAGFDGIVYKNNFEGGGDSHIVFNKSQINQPGVEKSNLDWAKKVEQAPFGGVNPNDPEAPSKKYAFELSPENRHTPENLTAQEAQAFSERPDVKELLATHPDIKLGWDTTTQGRPELNIGVSTNDLDTAKKVAGKLDQRAIVDTQTGDEIPAGGTGAKTEFPDYPLADRLKDLGIEKSDIAKSPKGSSVPLMDNPLEVKPGKGREDVNTLDLTKALNQFSRKQLPALEPGSEPKEMVARAKKIAEDEAKYQLAQSKTGTEWYTTEMKDHDKVLTDLRPELLTGPETASEAPWTHTAKMTLFKAAEAILSSGQKPYANVKSALRAWDAYNETGEFPRSNPATGKEGMSWGPRNVNAYGNAFDNLNRLIKEKGEKGAADWLLSEHPTQELKEYKDEGLRGKKDEMQAGAMILGNKRGPFMQNLHGIESKFTADMWVSRSWNRWMGTLDLDPRIEAKGKVTSESDVPRNNTERSLMKESFEKTANKLGLTTSSLQAVLWYYEQALYRAHGIPVESWSFSDAAKRVGKEATAPPEAEQTGFGFGANEPSAKEAGFRGLTAPEPKNGGVHAIDLINALKK